MKLALVRQRYTAFGGAERFVERAIEALGRDDIDLTLLTRQWSGTPPAHLSIRTLKPFYLGRTWRDWSFARAVQAEIARTRYDLVQSHERVPGCDVYRAGDGTHVGWLAHRARAAKRSFDHDAWAPYHRYLLGAEARMFGHPRLRAVICISRMVQREVAEYFDLPDDRLPLVYNGIDLQRFTPATEVERLALRRELDLPPDAPVLLFVGSGFARKGVRPLLNTLPREAHLVVVGRDKDAPRYVARAQAQGLGRRVHFVGPQHDVRPWYRSADAFVFPTFYEPFGNVVLEALACGLPVVTTRQCGAGELIAEGWNGLLCDAFAEDSLRAALDDMSALVASSARHRAWREHARATAEGHSLEAMGERLVALYRGLLG